MKELFIVLTIIVCVAVATLAALYVAQGYVTTVDATAMTVFSALIVNGSKAHKD